jgi:hypothetical protein
VVQQVKREDLVAVSWPLNVLLAALVRITDAAKFGAPSGSPGLGLGFAGAGMLAGSALDSKAAGIARVIHDALGREGRRACGLDLDRSGYGAERALVSEQLIRHMSEYLHSIEPDGAEVPYARAVAQSAWQEVSRKWAVRQVLSVLLPKVSETVISDAALSVIGLRRQSEAGFAASVQPVAAAPRTFDMPSTPAPQASGFLQPPRLAGMASIMERYGFHARDLNPSPASGPEDQLRNRLREMLRTLALRRVSGQLRPDEVSEIQQLERDIEDELDGLQRPGGA